MKRTYIVFIIVFSFFYLISGCGKKNETNLTQKDSTSLKGDSSAGKQNHINEKDEPGFYDLNVPFDEYIQKHPNLNKKIDFEDLVESLAVNKYSENDKRERLQNWTVLADKSTSPVNWLSKGANLKRNGEVI